jgi:hypothetical protein
MAGPVLGAASRPLSEVLRGFGQLRVVPLSGARVYLVQTRRVLSWATRKILQIEHCKGVGQMGEQKEAIIEWNLQFYG